jgi:PmbA protein
MMKKVFDLARKKKITELEIITTQNRTFSVQAYEGKIESYKKTNTGGIGVRGTYKNHTGYSYSERVNEDEFEFLLNMMISNASLIDDEKEPLYNRNETGVWRDIQPEVTEARQMELALSLEKEALQQPLISQVTTALVTSGYGKVNVANSYGLNKTHEANFSMAFLSVVAKQGDEVETDSAYYVGDLNNISISDLVQEAANKARRKLGGKSVPTGTYAVILDKEVVCSLLQTYCDIFSARNVIQGMSRLEGKLGQKVFGQLDLVDDPLSGYEKVYFDSEGVTANKLYLVRDGVLESYLHSLQTAEQMKCTPTGHGLRGYKGTVQIAPHRMQIPPGTRSFDDLLKEMGNGLYITDVQGLHSGTNRISGDFSLAAQGFLVENGELAGPIKNITIAHNFFQLFSDPWIKGNDFEFSMPGSHSQFASPSILFPKMSVSS